MNRMPVARNPLKLMDSLAQTVLTTSNVRGAELLMTSVPPKEGLLIDHVFGVFSGRVPLRTLSMRSWPESMPGLQCLHCGGPCNSGPPVPACRQYDSVTDQYWVYGPFCRPACALGSICETDSTAKQLAASAEMLRRFFGLKVMTVAPPRAAHWRFGGPLNDFDFYGHSGYTCLTTVQPPFVTFAHYVVGTHGRDAPTATALLPQSAGRLVGLERPTERHTPFAEKRPSGRPPLLLEFLATLKGPQDVRDSNESIEVKQPKKRARTDAGPTESKDFLKQYIKVKAPASST